MVPRFLSPFPQDLPAWQCLKVLHDSTNAIIFLAQNKAGLSVAIKRFKFSVAKLSKADVERLLLGIKALALVNTHGLVQVLEVGVSEQAVYLVMEYVKGHTLKDYLQHKPLPSLNTRLQWFEELTKALQAVHELGLLHLDLKTSNVMIRETDNSVALLDFGLETHLLVDAGFMREDEIYCTPYYVSPERIMGDVPDERADLYALGVILYEMLIGQKPYESRSLEELLKKHAIAPIPQLPAEYAHYQPLLDKLLAKFPESRIQSAAEVVELLHEQRLQPS